jgi:hypothetical protein
MLRLFWDRNFAEQKLVSFHLRLGGHDESPNLPSYSVLIQQMAPGNNFADDLYTSTVTHLERCQLERKLVQRQS